MALEKYQQEKIDDVTKTLKRGFHLGNLIYELSLCPGRPTFRLYNEIGSPFSTHHYMVECVPKNEEKCKNDCPYKKPVELDFMIAGVAP